MKQEDIDKAMEVINTYIHAHMDEIRGIPMELPEVEARFIIYAASLIHFYKFSNGEINVLLQIAADSTVAAMPVEKKDKVGN